MSFSTQTADPGAELQRADDEPMGPSLVRQIEESLVRRSLLPLLALAITGAGLLLLVVVTVVAGALSDNWGAGVDAAREAATFRPWFRITLLTGVGAILAGIITMLLAIFGRIWLVTVTNQAYFPVIIDARRRAAGRPPRFSAPAADKGGD